MITTDKLLVVISSIYFNWNINIKTCSPNHIWCFLFSRNERKYDFCLSYFSDSGIGLESGVFVATLAPGSPAARDCNLTIGDRLLAVSMLAKSLSFTTRATWMQRSSYWHFHWVVAPSNDHKHANTLAKSHTQFFLFTACCFAGAQKVSDYYHIFFFDGNKCLNCCKKKSYVWKMLTKRTQAYKWVVKVLIEAA